MKEKWYDSSDTDSEKIHSLLLGNAELRNLIITNENVAAEKSSIIRIKISRMETDIDELKFCVYALMFLNTALMLALAFS